MFPVTLSTVEADNQALLSKYYVRLPCASAGTIPFAEREKDGDLLRGVTETVSAAWMHEKAFHLRSAGVPLFFAAMENGL